MLLLTIHIVFCIFIFLYLCIFVLQFSECARLLSREKNAAAYNTHCRHCWHDTAWKTHSLADRVVKCIVFLYFCIIVFLYICIAVLQCSGAPEKHVLLPIVLSIVLDCALSIV